MLTGQPQGLELVGPGNFSGEAGVGAETAFLQFIPFDGGLREIDQAEPHKGDGLVLDLVFGGLVPVVGGRYPQAGGEGDELAASVFELFAREGQEALQGALVHRGARLMAFALDGPVVAVLGLGHQIDAVVAAAGVEAVAIGEIPPKPDVGEKQIVERIGLEEVDHQPLETIALLALAQRLLAVFLQQLGEIQDGSRENAAEARPVPPERRYPWSGEREVGCRKTNTAYLSAARQ